MQGSRYKFVEMFAQVCDLYVVPSLKRGGPYDFAIVRGDKAKDFRAPLKHGIPYILIEHDVWTVRAGIEHDKSEQEMIESAAAVLFTSAHHEDLAAKYDVPPSEYIHLRPLARDLDFEPLPKLEGQNIVYAGGIMGARNADMFGYRKYAVSVFPALIEAGWTVHVYPAWNATDRLIEYKDIGCVCHEPVPQQDLYREMSQYQAAFQGYAEEGPQQYVASCRPNKLWDGLGAGIPILGYNTGTGAHIYEGRWGYEAATLADIPAISEKVLALEISDELRRSEVIDDDVEGFRRLIERAEDEVDRRACEGQPRIEYPCKLAVDIEVDGTEYVKGARIDRATAIAAKRAGLLNDPRIPRRV